MAPRLKTTAAAGSPPSHTLVLGERWSIADVEADFPGRFSFDTTDAGANATYYVAPVGGGELSYTGGEVTFCRDHFKPVGHVRAVRIWLPAQRRAG
jgi:hypothetical protein